MRNKSKITNISGIRNLSLEPRNLIPENRKQMSEDRRQITDSGNQIAWIVYSCNALDPPVSSIERCLTLCAMPHALCLFLSATRNLQPATRNPIPPYSMDIQ
jgi:hypothetical protein